MREMKTRSKTAGRTARRHAPRLVSLLLCLLLSAAFLTSSAEPADDRVKVVRVGWYESSFNSTDDFGRRSGYAYEYQQRIAAYASWRYEYIHGSWPELLQMLIDGEIDLMSDVSYTPERAELMLFPTAAMGSEDYCLFISPDNRAISRTDYTTLNGKKIGVNRGSVQADYFREWAERNNVEAELTEVTTGEDENLQMLQRGELDAYITVDSFEKGGAAEAGRPVPVCKIGSSDFYFAVSKGRPDLLQDLNTALNCIQEENRNYGQALAEKYLYSSSANAFLTPEESDWLNAHGAIRVGYQDNYLAFCAQDPETGELTGALKDYLEAASDCVTGAHIDFEPVAYATAAEAVEALRKGEVDCVFPANLGPSDAEDMGLCMTTPIMSTDVFAIVRAADKQLFSGREHVVVAVNEGNPNYDGFLRDVFPSWRTIYYRTTPDCLNAVSDGVADCVLVSVYRYDNIARQCEREHLTFVTTDAKLDYCFAVSRGNPFLYSILARVSAQVPDSTVHTALSRYVAENARKTLGEFLEENVWAVIGIAAAILLVILFFMIRSIKAQRSANKLIKATETDALTGLYNRDFFLEYAGKIRREYPDTPMDAVVLNIDRFHSVNALNGRAFGDRVLRELGSELRDAAEASGGIAGRFEADRFDLFCRSGMDYSDLYERLQGSINRTAPSVGIRLRMGVMLWEKNMEAVQQFDKARTACSLARDNYNEHLIIFDERMQEREDYEQRLLNDVQRALHSYEFEVYYQPQFDIRCDPPKIASAEALVRWNHPELGLIPPGDFIPLFERHGKIGDVDRYVWSETAQQIARWRDMYGVTIPISVNLSRVDVFDPALESTLEKLLAYHGLSQETLKLEVTESAYTGNAGQVVRVVESLRQKGYVVEMDDFGSGYSSLNMLSAMPVDVLKMDRDFIRKLGEGEKDTSLVALIIGIAGSLKIPVVAEGVETGEQLQILRELGCTLVQGFYLSMPIPADQFEEKYIRKMQSSGEEEQ